MRNFTREDLSGAGQYLIRMGPKERHLTEKGEDFPGYVNTSYLSTIMYKVGYITNNWQIGGNTNQITTLVSMADGWTRHGHFITKNKEGKDLPTEKWVKVLWNKEVFCNYLNNPDLSAEFRFATQEEVVRVVLSQNWRWR